MYSEENVAQSSEQPLVGKTRKTDKEKRELYITLILLLS